MMRMVFIGMGAGAASALLFASTASGTLFSVLLFALTPLPIMIAALGWNHWTGFIGAVFASTVLALAFGNYFPIVFGLSAWWLSYLTLLARPAPESHELEWYPIGRLVLWSAVIATLVIVTAVPQLGLDQQGFQSILRQVFEKVLQEAADVQDQASTADVDRLVDILVIASPPMAAMFWTASVALCLWLAALIAHISGRLERPWPSFSAMTFPGFALPLLAIAVAGSFLPDFAGFISRVFAGSLLFAYALLGLAVLHTITRQMSGRGFVLVGAYVVVLVLIWPILLMSLLGIADNAFRLRARLGDPQGPPSASPV